MFQTRFAIFTIILATTALTLPIIEPDRKTNVKAISLTKRSSWLKPENRVGFDALHSHVESVNAKILRGLENYERNTGMAHPLEVNGAELLHPKKRSAGAATLTKNDKYLAWYGTITVGTPPKSFTVEIDTGSSDIFLPGPTCSGCSGHTPWDPASSRTAGDKGSAFHIDFEDGIIVTGQQYIDNVTIAGLSADTQTIGVATTYSTELKFPPDGALGMAFQSVSMYSASPFFETLVDEGRVTEPVFSMTLTIDGGELYLGGKNDDLYEGEIIYTPVTVAAFWQVTIQQIRSNDQTVMRNIRALIDTGANMIVGDPSRVAKLHARFGGKSAGDGYYTFPCDNFPTISFYFGGATAFRIPASILNMGPVRTGSPDCFSGIIGRSVSDRTWILGAVFLMSVYTVFDFGNQQVGFATLVGSSRAI